MDASSPIIIIKSPSKPNQTPAPPPGKPQSHSQSLRLHEIPVLDRLLPNLPPLDAFLLAPGTVVLVHARLERAPQPFWVLLVFERDDGRLALEVVEAGENSVGTAG